ncbi:MAG: glycoside hydrolase family 2, partial [Defluviitaleaceae bacterium]|nr:glycoside hydrolase family 2 [Defluviitaleaceae bacterium]
MENFNCGWEFMLENESDWKAVELPHDWLISDVRNLYKNGVGLYRKRFKLDETLSSDERLFLHFDGVYQDSALYVNGNLAGEWKNGYTAFSHEITPFLSPNENEILLKVNYESPNTRWYSGAGIYRDCFLIRKNATHFKHNGIYLSTRKQSDSLWHIEIDAEITSPHPKPDLQFSLQKIKFFEEGSLGGETFFQKSFSPQGLILSIENPQLWDISNPICYELKCELIINNVVVDTAYVRFGFREIKFTSEGFFLNGRRVQLNGVCHHHDLGALGSAVSKDAIRRQLMIYRDMGVNAIRTAHNPPAAVFMELCDEMGFLVMSEFTDVWKRAKTKFDYARFFEEWAVRDVESWVKRDRNCPSLIMWSVGNEVYDTHADYEDGSATLRFLMEETRKHDPKNNAEITLCSNYMPWENTQKCADIVKLMGYNYADYLYAEHRAKHPDWIIYGSETAATVQSRGVYHFPLAKALLADDDLQCSALGNSATSWGAKSTEAVIAAHADNMGQFIWSGFDYIG